MTTSSGRALNNFMKGADAVLKLEIPLGEKSAGP